MSNWREIFNYARTNNSKALNKSINDVGRKHHAFYMTNMMFSDDILKNYQLINHTYSIIQSIQCAINENYGLKGQIGDVLNIEYDVYLIDKKKFCSMTEEEMFQFVLQQSFSYYFNIDLDNETDFDSYYIEALQYRLASNFLQNDIERILQKMQEDIEIIIQDTKNLQFLFFNYKKLEKNDGRYKEIKGLLVESLQNILIKNDKFNENYFELANKLNYLIQHNLTLEG